MSDVPARIPPSRRPAAASGRLRPWQRRTVLLVFSLVLSGAVLLLLEGSLRLAGFGGYPSTFTAVGELPDGSTLVYTSHGGPSSYFFANRSQGGSLEEAALVNPKPAGTFRVFVVGGSAAKGNPYPQRLAASSFLREMLQDAWPERQVEVINLGTTAVASFPVLGLLTEALEYEPDLMVVYSGNNEFYGAYGVASLHSAGRSPATIRLLRATRSTATAQALDRLLRGGGEVELTKTLMETMVGQSYVGPDDPARAAAARNLETFIGDMVDRCRARGVPVVVCTPPCNERDLAPLGAADLSSLPVEQRGRVEELVRAAAAAIPSDAAEAEALASEALSLYPHHARAHYLRAEALRSLGRHEEAANEYRGAVELDPMPWRPPGRSVEAVRRAAARPGAVLCDLAGAFRDASAGGATGWELMDDHVHASLRGQELIARSIVRALAKAGVEGVAVGDEAISRLGSYEAYAERLGVNPYDEYAAAHAMRLLGDIPFFRETNPDFFARFDEACRELEASSPPPVAAQLRAWQDPSAHQGGSRPITGMVGRAFYAMGMYEEASRLFNLAARSVTPYSSWELQYLFSMLTSRSELGELSESDRAAATEAIRRGRVLLSLGESRTGAAERYTAELHLMLDQPAEAIPLLAAARAKLPPPDGVLADISLVRAYLAVGQADRARAIVEEGLRQGGGYAERYAALMRELPRE